MEITFLHLGEFARAREHFEKALSLYDPERHRDDAFFYSQNPGVAMRCYAAWALWFLGQPDQALNRIKEALTLARELSEPHGLAHALFFAAILHQLRREERMAQEHAEAAIAVSTRTWAGDVPGNGNDCARLGADRARANRKRRLNKCARGLPPFKQQALNCVRPHFLALLAEALDKARQVEEGLRVLEEALALVHRNGERYYQAELYRLKGELLLMQSKGRAVSQTANELEKRWLRPSRQLLPTPKAVSISPSRLPNGRRRSPWNCAR